MRYIMSSLLLVSLIFQLSCSSNSVQSDNKGRVPSSQVAVDGLNCDNVINLADYKGKTYLNFMENTVRPLMVKFATDGYVVADKERMLNALKHVSEKVRKKAIKAGLSEEGLGKLAEKLGGKTVNLYKLPDQIARVNSKYSRYDLSTFVGLASCGGAVVTYFPGNYAYNIHYGSGTNDKDQQTGRSFGAGPTRLADDASDKAYLTDLQEFIEKHEDPSSFYKTLIEALTASDTSNYGTISPFGQTLLTDFLAVYTAEQARNLMDNKVTLHWDAALLEVTLLSAFHAGQDEIYLYFKIPNLQNPRKAKMVFTSDVVNQEPGGTPRTKKRKAKLIDYWQFSTKAGSTRSGINLTDDEFRKLGEVITAYEKENNPEVVANVYRHFKGVDTDNAFKALSQFLINTKTPIELKDKAYQVAEDMTAFLMQVKKDAQAITNSLK